MHISAMPPGASPKASVNTESPDIHASKALNSAAAPIAASTVATTAPMNRGAPWRKSCWKREPSMQPSRHCAAFEIGTGIAERCTSAAVSGIATASEPRMNALGTRSHCATAAPASVASISSAKPAPSNAAIPGT